MKRLLSFLMIWVAFAYTTNAQETVVTGKVTSQSDGEALIGVSVVIKGTSKGVITNIDGVYSIPVDQGSILSFSFVGYLSEEVTITDQSVVDIQLTPDLKQLEEVVVTALGITKEKKTLGYAVTDVDGDELTQARENNVINSLNGKVAGLTISQTASGVAGSNRVVLRGNSSLTGNNEVLYVIDGIPFDNTSNQNGSDEWGNGLDLGNGVGDLNPDDIESVSVLKGANAAALYGSRAANGAIVITTKKGKSKGLGVSFSSNYVFEDVAINPEYQNKFGQGELGAVPDNLDILRASGSWGAEMNGQTALAWDGTQKPYSAANWNYKDFYNVGSTWTNSLALDGATENSSIRLSYTNVSNKGIVPNSSMSKNSFSLRGSSKLGEKLTFDAKVTYTNQLVKNRPFLALWADNTILNLNNISRNVTLDELKDYTDEFGVVRIPFSTAAGNNPYHSVNEVTTDDIRNRVYGFASITYEFTNWFKLMGRAGTDFSVQNYLYYAPSNHPTINGGRVDDRTYSAQESNYDFLAMINTPITESLDFSLNMGGNIRKNFSRVGGYVGDGLTVDGIKNITNVASYAVIGGAGTYEKVVRSLYANGQFGYKNFLFLDWTVRNDWSSSLWSPVTGNDNVSYFYPSASLSGIVSEVVTIPGVDFFKIRASWAQVGNDTDPYRTSSNYATGVPYLGRPVLFTDTEKANENLKPERMTSTEIGTDIRFFQNRIGVDFTYYNSTTVNQIMPLSVPTSSGVEAMIINAGEVQNSGVELLLNFDVVRNNDFNWELTFNMAKNNSKVITLSEENGIESIDLGDFAGNIPFAIRAVSGGSYGEIYARAYQRNDQGQIVVDDNGVPLWAEDGVLVKLGDVNPDFTAGLGSSFSYKNFGLSFLINGSFGGQILSITDYFMDVNGMSQRTLEGRDGFIVPNSVLESGSANTIETDAEHFYNRENSAIGSRQILEDYVIDASYIKFKELTLSYKFPQAMIDNTPLRNLTVSLVGRNLFFLKRNTKNFDPEYSGYNSGNAQGVEYLSLPSTRTYGVNLSVNF